MPKDHFWNKRSNKKESTLDGTKTNGLTSNGAITRDGGTARSSQKVGKTNSSGTGIKHLFSWGPIRKKSAGDDSKVPRSVSSSALSETRTLGFKRTASNGEVESIRVGVDHLLPVDRRLDQRQRHSSDRALQTKNSSQIYSLPVDTIKKVNSDHNQVKSPSPVNLRPAYKPQQDYTEPLPFAAIDGTKSRSNIHHIKAGSSKKKETPSISDTSVSPPSLSPEVNNDVNSDDYEEPWDKYPGAISLFRKKSKEKPIVGRISPKPPAKLPADLPKPSVEITKPLPPLPPLADDDDDDVITKELTIPAALPKRSVSLKASSLSDYSFPLDTKRISDTSLPIVKPIDQCSSHGGSSSEELKSPSPPPLPVRYISAPLVNANLPLEQQP